MWLLFWCAFALECCVLDFRSLVDGEPDEDSGGLVGRQLMGSVWVGDQWMDSSRSWL